MKTSFLSLIAVLLLGFTRALAHGGVELGPNGGRIVEFSKNETLHGEVTLADGHFHVRLLDKDLKPLGITGQSLVVTGGDRGKPEKPTVEKKGDQFVFPAPKGNSYLLAFQFKETQTSRTIIARFEYDATICSACNHPEWLCKCAAEEAPKDDKKPKDRKKPAGK